jgi:hypothetical protein
MDTHTRLHKLAAKAATFRGHSLSWGPLVISGARIRETARCRRCTATVSVDTRPESNGIDIGGDAVAVNCPVSL